MTPPSATSYSPSSQRELQLESENRALRVKVQSLEKELDNYKAKVQWWDRLHHNKAIKGAKLKAAVALKQLSDLPMRGDDGWIDADFTQMARVAGSSNPTISRGVHDFHAQIGAIELREVPHSDGSKTYQFRPKPIFANPNELKPLVEIPQHGGNRRCKKCGGEFETKERILGRQKYVVCKNCEEIHRVYQARDVLDAWPATHPSDEDDETDDATCFHDEIGSDNDGHYNDENVYDPEMSETFDDSVYETPFHHEIGSAEPEMEPPLWNAESATRFQNENQVHPDTPFHLETGSLIPNTAGQPALAPRTWTPELQDTSVLSPAETLAAASQLLLEIAGPNSEHIRMTNDHPGVSGKYITEHRPLTVQDTKAHILGGKTVGDTLKHEGGLTRALCYDADTGEEWEHLKNAARLLAAVDFKPLLIPSASQGKHQEGGHLWVIMDKLVDAYSLHETVKQYAASDLQHIEEFWPGSDRRVRLPGGKYREAGRGTWVTLVSADGEIVSRDGKNLAQVLMEAQSSADLVTYYDQPDPLVQPPQPAPAGAAVLGKKGGGESKVGEDVAQEVITAFNRQTSWESLLGKSCGGKYRASWRGDRNPNVAINPDTDLAKDFSSNAWLSGCMDKYQVHCLIEGGQNWQEFKRRDLAERCKVYREAHDSDQAQPDPTMLFAARVEQPVSRDEVIPLEVYWRVGKEHYYPAIPEMGLESGMKAWHTYSVMHRAKLGDVVAHCERLVAPCAR